MSHARPDDLHCQLSIDEALTFDPAFPRAAVEQLADFGSAVMAALDLEPPLTVSLHVTTDAAVRQLNRDYRDQDKPTDVLSFKAEPLPPHVAAVETPHLGDLIVAYPYTLAQAQAAGHAPGDEFRLLVIHGMLHLTGYHHDDATAQQTMWAKQAALLDHFGIPIDVPDTFPAEDGSATEDDTPCGS